MRILRLGIKVGATSYSAFRRVVWWANEGRSSCLLSHGLGDAVLSFQGKRKQERRRQDERL